MCRECGMAQGLEAASWTGETGVAASKAEPNPDPVKKSRVMGSRRIFPPQFKLLVLDSYRTDVDCRGNQRATARKYNIHRRQIQKWLQCEHHLRSAVEGDTKDRSRGEKRILFVERDHEAFAGGEAVALNRSATIPTRLGDAHENRLTPVGTRSETKVMDPDTTHSRLKLVAQKLYPRSVMHVPLELEGSRDSALPSECLFNEATDRKSLVNSVHAVPSAENSPSNKVSISAIHQSKAALLKENSEGQKFCNVQVKPESLVQKYIDDSDGPKLLVTRDERDPLLEVETSSLESKKSSSMAPGLPLPLPLSPSLPSTPRSGRSSVDDVSSEADSAASVVSIKSFTPKRKWMQESLQELQGPVLPPKQRVKMSLRSPTSPRPAPPKTDFSIERLCSPTVSPQPEWSRTGQVAPSAGYNYSPLQFPPPLVLQHRVIPDLVTLHFKPEVQEAPSCDSPPSCPSTEFPCKEEFSSDSDDGSEVDVLSTTPVEKKAFDLSGYHNTKRRSFSVQFKLSVLDAFYNDKDCNKNQRATARKFNINRRQVQKWLSQESDLRSEEMVRGSKYLGRQRLEMCTQCPQHCSKRRKIENTIKVNVKSCSDEHCLSRECLSSELGGSNIPVYAEPMVTMPTVYPSALSVPTVRYMSWYNFDIRHEKGTIY